MTRSKIFLIASILTLILYSMIIIIGLVYAIYSNLMPYHIAFIGMTVSQVSSFNPQLVILSQLSIFLIGFLFISSGALMVIIWHVGFRKAEKWSWIANLAAGALVIIPLLYVTFTVAGLNFPFPLICICLAVWIVAISLSIKEVFMNDAS